MTPKEIIELFYDEMLNEIFHSSADDALQTLLIDALKRVKKSVTETYDASKK